MNRVEAVRLLCIVKIKHLREREIRLREEIEDGKILIHYLEKLHNEIKQVNVLNYMKLDKKFFDWEGNGDEKK
jgi:hypothetical protein